MSVSPLFVTAQINLNSSWLILGMQPYFDPTRRNIKEQNWISLEFEFHFIWKVKNLPSCIRVASFDCWVLTTLKCGFQIELFVLLQSPCLNIDHSDRWCLYFFQIYWQTAWPCRAPQEPLLPWNEPLEPNYHHRGE